MAESMVAQASAKFFCHKCNVEIERVSAEYTCPLCASGFIEELPPNSQRQSRSTSVTDDMDLSLSDALDNPRQLNERLSSILMSSLGGAHVRFMVEDDPAEGSTSTGQRRRGRRVPEASIGSIVQEFLSSITGEGTASPSGPLFFMGNPGDYAWGREGIDTVITQMLNQMDNAGPPPLSKEKIDGVERTEISDDQVEQKLQCSVCWDNFQKMETVRKLPCTHIYHENCIVPWLQLHGTCPVCRQPVDDEPSSSQSSTDSFRFSAEMSPPSSRWSQRARSAETPIDDDSVLFTISSPDVREARTVRQQRTWVPLAPPPAQQPQQQPQDPQPSQNSDNNDRRRDDQGNIDFDCD